ncbi:Rhomboid family protein [Methanosalsum zhilinae DSM 4017]|uniref:Rhomboid family protein n=1 Tax=Methanosalsum zhilinae (strain DSM 4017 / NBRC 107636 / OCM 62 / WeN5) TaxID=679901 RepID=F7XMA2_METZD|nr:rhomboid family intramembrane serine protease [Methanosalsum zhilinae]AEH60994.1 Rhomboid family protein [Methanosalsum zhilinae DSM 4017]
MSKECWICGKKDIFPYKCRYCGKEFCSDHRLPERHACEGLESMKRGSWNKKKSQPEDLFNDVLKQASVQVGKSAIKGITMTIKKSLTSSPSMTIIAICIISFILGIIPGYFDLFKFDPTQILAKPWAIITYMFLHAGVAHLFFNMLVLFFFGRELERRVGNTMFLKVFFISGIVAALGYSLTSDISMVGASGAIYGVFAAVALLAPDLRIYIYFFPMKIKYALVIFAAIDFLLISAPTMIAHSAHLMGLFTGLLMGYYIKKANKEIKYRKRGYYHR